MQPLRPSIWSHDSNETASRKPGALQPRDLGLDEARDRDENCDNTTIRAKTLMTDDIVHRWMHARRSAMCHSLAVVFSITCEGYLTAGH